jgi:hypothetical protein
LLEDHNVLLEDENTDRETNTAIDITQISGSGIDWSIRFGDSRRIRDRFDAGFFHIDLAFEFLDQSLFDDRLIIQVSSHQPAWDKVDCRWLAKWSLCPHVDSAFGYNRCLLN